MTETELIEILKEYRVPLHIRKHMSAVADIAMFIGQRLIKYGHKLDLKSLRQAALLHDFLKICDFPKLNMDYFTESYTDEDIAFWNGIIEKYHKYKHIIAAYKVLKSRNELKIATIIKKHGFTSIIAKSEEDRPITWEEKVLYYADKRVLHHGTVTLQERIDDGRRRYYKGKFSPHEDAAFKALRELEIEICKAADISPADINDSLIN